MMERLPERCNECDLPSDYCKCSKPEYRQTLIPLCPVCYDDIAVYCQECGNDYIGCDCIAESNEWFCMKCDMEFEIDVNDTAYNNDYDYDVIEARSSFQGDDGRWYWDDGTEAKCYCYVPKKFVCQVCEVSRDNESDPWNAWIEININEKSPYVSPYVPGGSYGDFLGKCNHLVVPILLKEVTVYASSLNDRRTTNIPDFGLYADWNWNPWWRNEHIDWRDYGMPTDYEIAFHQISDAYNKAKSGQIVEIGCIGGHGRTGTILACMAVLDGMTPDEAVKHLETVYCHLIIETNEQEWFVHWFEARLHGKPTPAKPTIPPVTQTACTIAQHSAMLKGGLTECKFVDCKTFELDKDRYLSGEKVPIKTIAEIAAEMAPKPTIYPIGSVKDGFVRTMDGWTPIPTGSSYSNF